MVTVREILGIIYDLIQPFNDDLIHTEPQLFYHIHLVFVVCVPYVKRARYVINTVSVRGLVQWVMFREIGNKQENDTSVR